MKKNKAFTLVELIGVVVILGILMLILFPTMLNGIKHSGKKLENAQKRLVLQAAELYAKENSTTYLPYDGSKYCISLKELLEHDMLTKGMVQDVPIDTFVLVSTSNQQTDYMIDSQCSSERMNIWVKADSSKHGLDGANPPLLDNGMIPIKYRTKEEQSDAWYDYKQGMWANAVLVTEKSRKYYENASVGTEVREEDILGYFVWIPRYAYQLWNVEGHASSYPFSISIQFQKKQEKSTGVFNGSYFTHPAFTFGGKELSGIWVSKFSTTGVANGSCFDENCDSIFLQTKPNQIALQISIRDFFYAIRSMNRHNNPYGLTSKINPHMIKNIEYGAILYLYHSPYGRCSNGICSEISYSDCWGSIESELSKSYVMYTGKSVGKLQEIMYGTDYGTYFYDTPLGYLASTTGNIYGVYDMSGGIADYMMSIIALDPLNSDSLESGFLDFQQIDSKYYDVYTYQENETLSIKLGDATSEMLMDNTGDFYQLWYQDMFSNYVFPAWVIRGGNSRQGDKNNQIAPFTGAFYQTFGDGSARGKVSTRIVLAFEN